MYCAIGLSIALPVGLLLFIRVLLHPVKALKKTDWDKIELGDPVPDLEHLALDVGGGVTLHAARPRGGAGKPLLVFLPGE